MRGGAPALALLLAVAAGSAPSADAAPVAGEDHPFPNLVLVTIDTLRADRMSEYGYGRRTSPHLDRLMAAGVRFTEARTPEPLTGPAMASMLTALHPHAHGATRNGLSMRPGLPSFAKILGRRGYATAAFVGNWTLRDRLSGLGEHFATYEEVLSRRRWLFLKREATADDLNERAIDWLDRHLEERGDRPFLLWVHYVEPHAPYHLHREYLDRLGLPGGFFSPDKRYDTEVAYVDERAGRLLWAVRERVDPAETLVLFASDHGESLGEHGYWGHGRHLYEATLHVPLSFTWPGRIPPATTVEAPATLLDVPATLLGLAGFPRPEGMQGVDWAPVIRGDAPPPERRATYFQAHRSSVEPREEQVEVRRRGLLEVARLLDGEKEIFKVGKEIRRVFDLAADRGERENLSPPDAAPSEELAAWLEIVRQGLAVADEMPAPALSEEDLEALEALGYVD